MIEAADIEPGHVVVELGAGTGPMTREIQARAGDNPFLALEPNAEMAAVLRERVAGVQIVEGFAQDLPSILAAWGHPKADRIVSSLPFAAWPDAVQDEVMDAIVRSLNPSGRLLTFSYVHAQVLPGAVRFRKRLKRTFNLVNKTKTIVANVPPAFVYVCEMAK